MSKKNTTDQGQPEELETLHQVALSGEANLYQVLAQNIAEAFWIFDLEQMQLRYVSPSVEDMLGYTPEEATTLPFTDLVIPESVARIQVSLPARTQRAITGDPEAITDTEEIGLFHKDGSVIWTENSITFIPNDAGKLLVLGISRDISERRRQDALLRESEARYRDLVENIQEVICTHDMDGNLLSVNRAAEHILQMTRAEILKFNLRDLIAPEFQDQFEAYLAEIRAQGVAKGIMQAQLPNGARLVWQFHNLLKENEEGQAIVYSLASDITEISQTEHELRRQKELLQTIFDNIPVMIDLYDNDGKLIYANKAWEMTFGWDLDEVVNTNILSSLYPDPTAYQVAIESIIRAEAGWHRFQQYTRDGRMLDTEWANMRLSNGTIIGIGQNITQLIEAKKAGQESEKRYQQLVEIAPFAIAVYVDGKIAFANPAAVALVGAESLEDYIGTSVLRFIHPDSIQDVKAHRDIFRQGSRQLETNEIKLRCADGEIKHIAANSVLIDFQGQPAILSVFTDITERNLAEEKIRSWNESLEARVEQRTAELRTLVNAMAGREVRMAELKKAIRKLRAQLQEAGLTPVANDPLLEDASISGNHITNE